MKVKKELLALTASVLVIVLALSAVTELVTPKRHTYGSDWGEYLQEEEDSLDVLFIGSSLTYCNIIPAVFWQETGLTAFDVTGPELTVPMAKYYLEEALKTQSPSVVFIEISAAQYPRYTSFTKTVIGQMPWGVNRLKATFQEAEPELIGGLLFPMYFYHSRWTELNKDDFSVLQTGYQVDLHAGYTYLNQYRVIDGYTVRTDVTDEENLARNTAALHEIAQICLEKGITPVFYESPAAAIMPPERMDPLRRELAAIDGAVVVNFNDYREAIGAALDRDYYDNLHYNAAGAEKFTRFLGQWVRENLTVTAKDGQDTALWQSRLDDITQLLEQPMNPA